MCRWMGMPVSIRLATRAHERLLVPCVLHKQGIVLVGTPELEETVGLSHTLRSRCEPLWAASPTTKPLGEAALAAGPPLSPWGKQRGDDCTRPPTTLLGSASPVVCVN